MFTLYEESVFSLLLHHNYYLYVRELASAMARKICDCQG